MKREEEDKSKENQLKLHPRRLVSQSGSTAATSFRAETGPRPICKRSYATLPLQTLSIKAEKRPGGRNWAVVGQQGRRLVVCLCGCPVSFAGALRDGADRARQKPATKKNREG